MNQQTRSKLSFWLRAGILTVLFLGFGVASVRFLSKQRKKPVQKSLSTHKYQIPSLASKKRVTPASLTGFGTARSVQSVDISSEVAGRITWMAPELRVGGRVKKGVMLLRIDSSSYRIEVQRIKAQLASVRTQIKVMGRALSLEYGNLQRNRRLYKRKVLDRGSLDQKTILYHDRKQRLESMKQNEANLRHQLSNARLKWNKAYIRSPFDGRITKRMVEKGGFVGQGRALFTVESRTAVEIPVAFSLRQLSEIRDSQGRPVDLEKLPAYLNQLRKVQVSHSAKPGHVWKGEVARVGADVDRKTHTVTLWIRVPLQTRVRINRRKTRLVNLPTLLPGTFCRTSIALQPGAAKATLSQMPGKTGQHRN